MAILARLQRMNHGSGFRAYALRGGAHAEPIDPFLGVDHAWISAPTFTAHPHAGFSAVSYLFLNSETGILNQDSLGNRNLIAAGGLHWTAAGRGVVHDEVPATPGKTVHMLQIFVNLPLDKQDAAPFALSLAPEDVPVVQLPGVRIRVPLGQFGEARSPLVPPTPVTLLDISLERDSEVMIPIAAGHSAFVVPIHGSLDVNGQACDGEGTQLPIFLAQEGPQEIRLQTRTGEAKAVLFSGQPLHQEVHWRGSLALASAEALSKAVIAYERGEFGTLNPT